MNADDEQQAMSRRQVVMIAAGLATAGALGTWFYSSRYRRTTVVDGAIVRPGQKKRLPPEELTKELAKAGPLPEIIFGKEDAPVTIVEYADLTCPACANFHKTVLPQLKEKYVDTGKVRIVFREFPTNTLGFIAFMTVRCVSTEKAPPLLSALFARQQDWTSSTTIDQLKDKLYSVAQQVGLTRQAFDACVPAPKGNLTDAQEKLLNNITSVRDKANESFGVSKTPTFFVNGKRLPHATMEEFEKAIAPLVTP
jgi:protein-disulfide isomerase